MSVKGWRGPSGPAEYFGELRGLIDAALEHTLPASAPPVVLDAMRYSLCAGGKRLRPALALAAADAIAASHGMPRDDARARAMPAALALELIHTYSLIHDDLPAMDDDTLRRGRPTSHVVFGDGMAVLAGDGLLTEAFAILCEPASRLAPHAPQADAATRLEAAFIIAKAAGANGMVGGQAIDLHAAGKTPRGIQHSRDLDAASLRDMHLRKTGALIRAAAVSGGLMAGASRDEIASLDEYGTQVGLAFQIVDDLLDVEGTDAALGKTAGKDAAAGKPTYPSLFGLEESRRLAAECVDRAAAAAARIGGQLEGLARLVIERQS